MSAIDTVSKPRSAPLPAAAKPIPRLENGDRLTRAEFERRYTAMPEVKKAELIEGRVHMPSPVRHEQHSSPQAAMVGWLVVYSAETPGVEAGDNGTIRLDLDNEPQPDGYLIIRPERGGQAQIDSDDYIAGAPELVVEVAASNVSVALNDKLNAYRRNGVREYTVWRAADQELDWFVLRDGAYARLQGGDDGILKSEVFPGLWLDAKALLARDLRRVLEVLQRGLASPEHAAFARRLPPG